MIISDVVMSIVHQPLGVWVYNRCQEEAGETEGTICSGAWRDEVRDRQREGVS